MHERKSQLNATPLLLLVGDNPLSLAYFVHLLECAGYEVITAESADEAEALIIGSKKLTSPKKPDLVIIDYQMSALTGFTMAAQFKLLADVPVMFLSTYTDQNAVKQATQLGSIAYIARHAEQQQLVPAIESALASAYEIKKLREKLQQLQLALELEREINVAVGITMVQQKIPRSQAFEALRKSARDQRRKLSGVASEMLQLTESVFAENKS